MSEQKPNQTPIFSSFADWCKHKDSLSEEAKDTLEILLKNYARSTSNCNQADRILSSLIALYIENGQISDLSPLSNLTNLTHLYLSDNQICNLSPLSGLTNLTRLYLNNNNIFDLSPLSGLTNLTHLYLNDNQIVDLNPLSSLTNLTDLYLSDNQIVDLSPLSSLTNLTRLYLDINKISDLSPLSTLTNLTHLALNVNQIVDLSPLSTLANLITLELDYNQISEPRPLSTLTKLSLLYLNVNPIPDLSLARSLEEKLHALYQKPIDRQKATEAVKFAYTLIHQAKPEIIFCSSPHAAIESLGRLENWGRSLAGELCQLTQQFLSPALWQFLWSQVLLLFRSEQENSEKLERELLKDDPYYYDIHYISPEYLVKKIILTQYCISQLEGEIDSKMQQALQCLNQLFKECGWIFAYENICIVCDRPTQLFLDSQNRLHAEGKPAIQFADGYSLYSYRGVTLPEKYGKFHPNDWRSQWILSEENTELRRVLIQGIGYSRICQKLEAEKLDTWREYTLLKINADLDGFDLDNSEINDDIDEFDADSFDSDNDIPKKEPVY